MLRIAIVLILFAHGIGHSMGLLQLFKLAAINPAWKGGLLAACGHSRVGHRGWGQPGDLRRHRARRAERMIVYPAMLWTLTVGGYLLAGSDT